MRIGQLRYRIRIERIVENRNTFGEAEWGWEYFATVWAKVESLRGRELVVSRQIFADVTTKFTIRFKPTITSKMQILHRGKPYDIKFVDNVGEANRYLEILAVEKFV